MWVGVGIRIRKLFARGVYMLMVSSVCCWYDGGAEFYTRLLKRQKDVIFMK